MINFNFKIKLSISPRHKAITSPPPPRRLHHHAHAAPYPIATPSIIIELAQSLHYTPSFNLFTLEEVWWLESL
jgi:hypothetical protein